MFSLLAMHALDYCKLDVIEVRYYVVNIGRTDREQNVAESITTDAECFGHVGLCQLRFVHS